ncbi:DUF4272 domain-containing protein [Parvularcula lutaonensis]|uniref:DUF4272 domain-containing protein n=1 Tax=Parvularcula lutaonensis TaxID=491923 RepID=A0ABV7M9Q2_9PROT|nr:DUF4272 domain-containing protein [Parvularcula lutaonensis]GGY42809.1 hypothetical protein GCM10007148_09360 [Parvularcula lutaonensis]
MDPEKLKAETEIWLASEGIGFVPGLPLIEELDELKPRAPAEVMRRAFALMHLLGISQGVRKRRIKKALKAYRLWDGLTPIEQTAVEKRFFIPAWARIDTRWTYETIAGLGWCLGVVELNPFATAPAKLREIIAPWTDPAAMLAEARLRPKEELQVALDRHYRLHWAARHGAAERNLPPEWFSVIKARRHAIEWVCNQGTDWDDIPLDI